MPLSLDSSVGRAEDCSRHCDADILRSLVRIRLEGLFFKGSHIRNFGFPVQRGSSGVFVRSRVASDYSLDGLWVNPSFVDSMADMGLFLSRFGMNSMDNNRLALSGMGQLGFFALSFTIFKFQQSEEIPVVFYFYFKI